MLTEYMKGKEMKKQLVFEIKQLYHLVEHPLESMKQEGCGITKAQGGIIHFLSVNRGRDVFQRDIEEEFKIRRSSVSVLLSSMESAGYIERRSVEHDARLKKIVLTEKAVAVDKKIREMFDGYDAELAKNISDKELEVFYGVIDKIKTNIEEKERKGQQI